MLSNIHIEEQKWKLLAYQSNLQAQAKHSYQILKAQGVQVKLDKDYKE